MYQMTNNSKSFLFGSLLVGAVLAVGLLALRRRKKDKPKIPSTARWRRVGTLKNMLIFPIKSGGYVELEEADCNELGPAQVIKNGLLPLKDRNFIVYRNDTKEMMVCLTYPAMVSIKIQSISANSVLFKYRDKPDLEVVIPTPKMDNSTNVKTKMWTKETMDCLDCGDEAADWVTDIIKGHQDVKGKLRLGYWNYPDRWKSGHDANYKDRGAYHNYTSYMMMSNSSLADLESNLPENTITYKQFRPNFLVDTTSEPFAEENWKWVRIGDQAVFVKIKDCTRCPKINIDPETSTVHPKHEPLSTLKKYRKTDKGPIMGICLGLYTSGRVKIGDPVYTLV